MTTSALSSAESLPNFKVVLLGEGRVGKTSLLLRYVEDAFEDGRSSTFAASYLEKTVRFGSARGNSLGALSPRPMSPAAHLSIWDTAGQERYRSLGPIYYRDADGAILVYDVTDASTFGRVQSWVTELRRMVGDENRICLNVVGNKVDLLGVDGRAVSEDEALDYARSVGATHSYASAKTGLGVGEIFESVTRSKFSSL